MPTCRVRWTTAWYRSRAASIPMAMARSGQTPTSAMLRRFWCGSSTIRLMPGRSANVRVRICNQAILMPRSGGAIARGWKRSPAPTALAPRRVSAAERLGASQDAKLYVVRRYDASAVEPAAHVVDHATRPHRARQGADVERLDRRVLVGKNHDIRVRQNWCEIDVPIGH